MYRLCALKNLQNYLSQSIQIAKKSMLTKLLKDWVIQVLAVIATGHS